MLFVEFSLYLASRFVGKFEGKGVWEIGVKEGVDGSERVIKMCQMKRLLDHLLNLVRLEEKICVIQKGSCSVVVGGLKGFSQIFSDVGVELK